MYVYVTSDFNFKFPLYGIIFGTSSDPYSPDVQAHNYLGIC